MRNNETGEFELVVGNRQLLSGFFIVVLLFAVAFAMGYVVGENSKSAKAQTEIAGANPPAAPGESRPQPSSGSGSGSVATPSAQTDAPPAIPAESTPQPTTKVSREVPPPTRETPPPKREVPPPVRETPPPPKEKALPATSASAPPAEAAPRSYWQVLSTPNRDSAQTVAQSLQDKGLPATLSPGPNNFTRVLVGPYRDTAAMGKAKSELEAAGFKPVIH